MPDGEADRLKNNTNITLILRALDENNRRTERIEEKLDNISIEVAKLKVKSGLWGAVAGAIPASITIIYLFIKNKIAGN